MKRTPSSSAIGRIALLIAYLATGCASSSSGPAMSRAAADEICRGVTTREEPVARFGEPTSSSLMGDGRRMLVFIAAQTSVRPDGRMFIPFAGPFMNSSTRHTHRVQQLQAILNAADTVEDYEFSDKTSETDARTGVFGGSARTVTRSND